MHVQELGNDGSSPEQAPMIFLKAGSSVLHTGAVLQLPTWSRDVHHEVELAIELQGPDLLPSHAAVALDLTARDVQAQLKKRQWPWTLAKSFPHSTPLGTPFALTSGTFRY
jgi:2-keto-4-pentenoate hydratase/2-oxohepta-3-ene-1,7-dioic acid hydratase in catechol pathway